jgi:hypothetical protein
MNPDSNIQNEKPMPFPGPTRPEGKWLGLGFLILVPLAAHLLFSWMGMNPTDDGFFLGMGRRLLDGEIPHRDFITARPAGTEILWLPVVWLGGNYTIWISRFFVWFQFAAIAWIWTGVINRLLRQTVGPVEKVAVALAAFAVSAHTFIISPFPAVDGLWVVSIGLLFCLSPKPAWKFLGYAIVGAACLFKQNFLAVGPVFLVVLWDWRKIRYWLALALPSLAYLAFMWAMGAFADFKLQMFSHTELIQTGVRRYLHTHAIYYGFVAAYFGMLIGSGGIKDARLNLSRYLRLWLIAIGTVLVFVPPAIGVAMSWKASEEYSFALFGMVVGAALFFLCHREQPLALIRTAGLVLIVMWALSISVGCNYPVLGGGLAVAFLAAGLRALLAAEDTGHQFRPVWHACLLGATAVVMACFVVGRSWHIYMELPAWKLSCSLGEVLPGGKMIRTNPATCEYMKELHDLVQQLNGREYAVLPDAAIYWVKAPQKNPLPTSWPLDFELSTPALFNRFTRALEDRRGRLTILVAKVKGFELVNKAAPDWYAIVPYVETHFRKVDETKYWTVYE